MSIPFRRSLKDFRGFTLVELLVVIAIIGILATLLLLQLGTARARARDVKRIADVNQVRSAVELYFDDNGKYPNDISVALIGKYLTQVPKDPLNTTSPNDVYGYKTKDANQLQYQLWTELEQKAVGAMNADADIDASGWTGNGSARGGANGGTETCANASTSDKECVYDQGQS